jgi:adenylyltransferase/sulfurtransferase
LSHETYPSPVELRVGHKQTALELFEAVGSQLTGPLHLVLDRELVVAIECARCDWRSEVMRPRVKVKSAEAHCPNCREPARPVFESGVDQDSSLAAQPLSRLGIPPYDIVRVDGETESGFFLLTADREGGKTGWESGR